MQNERIDRVFKPVIDYGDLHYGEAVTQLEHALQCAQLAREQGGSPALIAAALLHDVGQFIDDAGNAAEHKGIDAHHEETGAAFLAPFFGPEVTEPMRLHVAAKRYLCQAETGYRNALSPASELSLRLQGGPMTEAEAEAFSRHPWFAEAISLRRCDDAAKRIDWQVPGLESYRSLLRDLLLPAG
ncbi:HD domain-containing protein [Novosphingobium sp.]|uniref:HD domain-containing protein n=1 Tax=Novosphingobium sp. TaxID=1874826 RepID=UPI0038BDCC40